jgi:hypothetical protein
MLDWNEYPLIKLKNMVEDEDWFKLGNGGFTLTTSEGQYQLFGFSHRPKEAKIDIRYRGEICQVGVDTFDGKFKIKAQIPEPRIVRKARTSKSKSVSKAFDTICDYFTTATEQVDVAVEKCIQEERRRQAIHDKGAEIGEKLNVALVVNTEFAQYPFAFQMSKQYGIRFCEDEDEENKFRIFEVKGSFGLETIQRIIDAVSEAPPAVADRILHGK